MDFIFKTNLFLSNTKIENISLSVLFKNCDDYDISKLNSLKDTVQQLDLKLLPDHIYSILDNKDFDICIEVLSDSSGYRKYYQPQNISVISKDNNPKGIMINDTAEVYNINNLPQDVKSKLILILCPDKIQNIPQNIPNEIPKEEPTVSKTNGDRSSLKMSPQFNDIYQETLKQMDSIKPSDDLVNEMQNIGGKDWVSLKSEISKIKGEDDASTT